MRRQWAHRIRRAAIAVGFAALAVIWGDSASWAVSTPGALYSSSVPQSSPRSASAATGSPHRSAPASTASWRGASAVGSTALPAVDSEPTPRAMDNDQYAALLFVGGVLVLTNTALLVLQLRRR